MLSLASYSVYLGNIDISAGIIIFILAVAGYNFAIRDKQNGMLRIIILLLVFWALFSQQNHGRDLLWPHYIEFMSIQKTLLLNLNLEKVLTAIILGSYLIGPTLSRAYLRKLLHSRLIILGGIYLAIIISVSVILHVFIKSNQETSYFINIVAKLFLISFSQEILYRLVIQRWVYDLARIKFGASAGWLAIALVSVVYGLFHLKLGLIMALFTTFVGAAYGYIYQKSGKIEAAILVHFAFRLTFCLIVAFLGRKYNIPFSIF